MGEPRSPQQLPEISTTEVSADNEERRSNFEVPCADSARGVQPGCLILPGMNGCGLCRISGAGAAIPQFSC